MNRVISDTMKILPYTIAFMFSAAACHNATEPERFYAIALGSQFQSDTVEISLDNVLLYNGIVTTDSQDGIAWISEARPVHGGVYTLQVKVGGKGQNFWNVDFNRDMTVVVLCDVQTSVLSIEIVDGFITRGGLLKRPAASPVAQLDGRG